MPCLSAQNGTIYRLLSAAKSVRTIRRTEGMEYLLSLDTPVGPCALRLFRNESSGTWSDICQYKILPAGALAVPTAWSFADISAFFDKYLFTCPTYSVLCSGGSKDVRKPDALRNTRQFVSVPFGEDRRKCQLFLLDNDLYIWHKDYLSPRATVTAPDGRTKGVILRRQAWLRVSDFSHLVRACSPKGAAIIMWNLLCQYHGWEDGLYSLDWTRFWEETAAVTAAAVAD